jgi:hypothetical protein
MAQVRRFGTRGALCLGASLTIAATLSCDGNPDDMILEPTGGLAQGIISGVLDYGEGFTAPYPETFLFTIPSYSAGCASAYSSMMVLGEMNAWDTELWGTGPGMTRAASCFWLWDVELAPQDDADGNGLVEWKFTTDGSWENSYAACDGCALDAVLRSGEADDTNGDNLGVEISESGRYFVLLNENTTPVSWAVPAAVGEANAHLAAVDETTGEFSFEGLEDGKYALAIVVEESSGLPVRVVRDVSVSGDAGTDLGIVPVVLSGGITGSVEFADAPDPRPEVVLTLSAAGAEVAVVTLAAGSAESGFDFTGLNSGSFDLRVHAVAYIDTLLTVEFVDGEETDLGTLVLQAGASVSGTMAFGDGPPDAPPVSIEAWGQGADPVRWSNAVSDTTNDSFLVAGLPTETLDLSFRATGYLDTTFAVSVTAPELMDIGTVTLSPGCRSVAETIHILGTFNNWDESLWLSDDGMIQTDNCGWVDTVAVFPAHISDLPVSWPEFKFSTDGDWGETPDYGFCSGSNYHFTNTETTGPVCLDSAGGNLPMYGAYSPGLYEVTLDEDSLAFRSVLVEAFASGIIGAVTFEGIPTPPYPPATVEVAAAATSFTLAFGETGAQNGVFSIDGLDEGIYDVRIAATGFLEATVEGVVVGAGETVDAGSVALSEGCVSAFTAIQVMGDFNGWSEGTPSMTMTSPCVWADTLSVSAGCHYMKFRTADAWGNDYGGCVPQDDGCGVGLVGSVCLEADPPAIGQVDFTTSGTGSYEFLLDERTMTYTITKLP